MNDPTVMWIPRHYTLDVIKQTAHAMNFGKTLTNTLVLNIGCSVVQVFACSITGYGFARFNFRGKTLFTLSLSSSLLVPISALLMPIYLIMSRIGLLDSKASLILVYAALGLPTSLFILRGTFLAIPREIEEAAAIDGSGQLRTFFQIVMPMAKSGLATAATLHFLTSWNEFMFALVLTKSERVRTLPLALNYFSSQFSFDYTAMFAAITMAVLPSILVYVLLQEQVTGSLVAGSVKG